MVCTTQSNINVVASIMAIGLAASGAIFGQTRIQAQFRARNQVERIVIIFLASSSLIAIITTIGIVVSVVFEVIALLPAGACNRIFI